MKAKVLIFILITITYKLVGQRLDQSEIIMEARRNYFDSLIFIYKGDIKGTVIIFKEEMPVDYKLPKTNNFIIVENRHNFLDSNNSKTNFTSNFQIIDITDTSLVLSFELNREYKKRSYLFSKKKRFVYPLINNNSVISNEEEYNEFLANNYFMYFVYKYNCGNNKWILIPEKSYRQYQMVRGEYITKRIK